MFSRSFGGSRVTNFRELQLGLFSRWSGWGCEDPQSLGSRVQFIGWLFFGRCFSEISNRWIFSGEVFLSFFGGWFSLYHLFLLTFPKDASMNEVHATYNQRVVHSHPDKHLEAGFVFQWMDFIAVVFSCGGAEVAFFRRNWHRYAHIYIYIYIYLEPQWPLFLKVNPQKQAFSNQNNGHLGSRYIIMYKLAQGIALGFTYLDDYRRKFK